MPTVFDKVAPLLNAIFMHSSMFMTILVAQTMGPSHYRCTSLKPFLQHGINLTLECGQHGRFSVNQSPRILTNVVPPDETQEVILQILPSYKLCAQIVAQKI